MDNVHKFPLFIYHYLSVTEISEHAHFFDTIYHGTCRMKMNVYTASLNVNVFTLLERLH